jgi:hypothetical protein
LKPASGSGKTGDRRRAFRGLALVFALTFLNLAGMLLTALGLNALGDWTAWQFVGLFGAVEVSSGLANVLTPNFWALPVVESETSHRTRVQLALETLLIPHWGGLARTAGGVVMLLAAGYHEGFGEASALILPFCLLFASLQLAVSALTARLGVAFPSYDVVQATLSWYRRIELPPVSLSASALQFVLSLITIPAISVLAPGAFYQPEIGPSHAGLAYLTGATLLAALAALAAWHDRLAWNAPPEQVQETEARV